MNHLYFAMYDPKDIELNIRRAPFMITLDKAKEFNLKKYGIFKTVQLFDSDVRSNKGCSKIASWGIDIDEGTKQDQAELICKINIPPSKIIESKNGFHIYFNTDDELLSDYSTFIKQKLVPLFRCDPKCQDLARILRLEDFFHWKDSKDPFMIKCVYQEKITYSKNSFYKLVDSAIKKLDIMPVEKNKKGWKIPVNYFSKKITYDDVLRACNYSGPYSKKVNVSCPLKHKHARGDKIPSMTVENLGDNILLYCHGCDSDFLEILEAIRGIIGTK